MATKKATYQYDNGSGWDEIMFKTTADQVVESSSKRFVSDTEKSTWNGKANASHTHNYAGSSSSGGAATTALVCSGNSATATKLATARTINGTSFDGSANITTSNWGTARTITIGSTGKSINGSTNVTWTLAEIGAAASSHTHNYAGSSSAGGSANTAVKLATARTISLNGDASGSTSFDGSGNVTITANIRKYCMVGSDSASSNGWYKVASQTMSGYGDTNATFSITSTYGNYFSGILHLQIRSDSTSISCKKLSWLSRDGFSTSSFIVNINGMTWTLYVNQTHSQYGRIMFEVISQSSINSKDSGMTLYNSSTKESTTPTATVTSSDGSTVAYANRLSSARNINGTSFNGSGDITTANWGTARTLTIGNSGKSVNGSGNVSWSLSEIGAAASSHTHNYAGSSSAGGSANTAVKLATARTINGTSFDGSANITTANWGTTRTLTIGNTGKSVNGSGNVSWSLSEIGAASSSHTHSYLPLSGGTLTGSIKSSLSTGTYLSGNQGNALLASTATAGAYTTLLKSNSTNGYFTLNNYQSNLLLAYTAKSTVDAGTNSVTKQVTLLNESGNTSFPGTVSASGGFSGALSGNASTATTLATARTINGTSFNGSVNITTANWGTARTLTIGNTGKSVNGSANVSWSLSEIGAASSSHTHSYLPLSGGVLTGDLKIQSSNAGLTLNGNSTNYYKITHSSANNTLVFTYNGTSILTMQNNGSLVPVGNKKLNLGDNSNKFNVLYTSELINDSAKIQSSTTTNTLQVIGTADSTTGAIKLGTGGCRIYGIGTKERLYVEGGIYTNLAIECGNQIISNGAVYPGKNAQGGWDLGLGDRRFYTLYAVNTNLSSDKSMKEDIHYIDNEIALLSTESENPTPFKDFICNDLKVATYKYKRQITIENEDGTSEVEDIEHEPQDSQIGFIAQDIRDTEIGSMFVYGEDGNMNYSPSGFTTVVAKALQEEIKTRDIIIQNIQSQIDELNEKINLLMTKL